MKRVLSFLSAAVAVGLAGAAFGNTTTSLVQVGSQTINGNAYNIYDLKITTDSNDLVNNVNLTLTSGSIYENTDLGPENGPPNPVLFPTFPNLQYDTYFTIPQDYPNASSNPASVNFLNYTETPTSISTSYNTPAGASNAAGTYVIAQLTLSAGATGTVAGTIFDSSNPVNGFAFSNLSIPSNPTPEPASLGVLALGGLALLARRRKAC